MTEPLTDLELIQEFKNGNIDAFEILVARHQDGLINFFYHCCRDKQLAEDYTQEVFVRLTLFLDRYVPRAKFSTYLYKIARNMWIDKLRSEKSHPRPVSLESPVHGGEGSLRDVVQGKGDAPVDIISRREVDETLSKVIDELPEELRMVLILSELHGMKYREIAEILDVPIGTVKSRMHTAVDLLKKKLTDRNMDEEEE